MPSYYNPYPYYYQPAQIPALPQQAPQTQSVAPGPIQSSGFVSVRSEEEAMNYPVAPGNSVTFKDEVAPYVYTKTMGFSQLDRPIFEKYKLVKEEPAERTEKPQNEGFDLSVVHSTIDGLKGEIEAIWSEIEDIKNARAKTTGKPAAAAKRDKDGDD